MLFILPISHGMTSLQGEALTVEEAPLQEVASALKTTASLGDLVAQAKKSS